MASRKMGLGPVARATVVGLALATLAGCLPPKSESLGEPPAEYSDDIGRTTSTASTLALGGSQSGTLNATTDIDMFRVFLPVDGRLTARTTGSTDTLGTLRDSAAAELLQDDDSGDSIRNFLVAAPLPAGTYYLEVTGSASVIGNYTVSSTFVPDPPKAARLAAGQYHTCAIVPGGSLKCWGYGFYGQLGQGSTTAWGDTAGETGTAQAAILLGTGRTATLVAAGDSHTCAVVDNGAVKCWGYNANGQLGLGDLNSRGDGPSEMGDALSALSLGTGRTARAIAAGQSHTCALLDDGTVKCWGINQYGQLGLGDTSQRTIPTSAVSLGTGRSALALATGGNHTCALLDNGTVKCWGYNVSGQLGLGSTANRGDSSGVMGDILPAVSLGSGRTAAALAAGLRHTCALLDNGTVKCWGYNGSGQLGLGDTSARGDASGEMGDSLPAVSLGTGRTATAIAAGGDSTCALLDNGTVKCWGYNLYGQLGVGTTTNLTAPSTSPISLGTGRTAIAIAAGQSHTCALLDNGTLKCWGYNINGQLGLGDTTTQRTSPSTTVSLTAWTPATGSFVDDFEHGLYSDNWTDGSGNFARMVTTATAAAGSARSLVLTGGSGLDSSGFFQETGVEHTFGTTLSPTRIQFYVRSTSADARGGNFVVRDSSGRLAFAFRFSDNLYVQYCATFGCSPSTTLSGPVNTPNTWYLVEFRNIDWTNKRFDFYLNGSLVTNGSGLYFPNTAAVSVKTIRLHNVDETTAYWDEIVLSP